MGDETLRVPSERESTSSRWAFGRMRSAVIVVVALVMAATGVFVVHRSSQCSGSSGDAVSMPSNTASPTEVAQAFVAAVNAGDRRTAEALTYGPVREASWVSATPEAGGGLPFFAHICQIQGFRVTGVSPDGSSMSVAGAMALVVAGTSGLDPDFPRDGDGKLRAGSFSLSRDEATLAWRVQRITPA